MTAASGAAAAQVNMAEAVALRRYYQLPLLVAGYI